MVKNALRGRQEGVGAPFAPDGRVGAVSRMDNRVVAEGEEHRADRCDERVIVAAGQIRAADRARKERVADEQILSLLAFLADLQTDASRAVPGVWCGLASNVPNPITWPGV